MQPFDQNLPCQNDTLQTEFFPSSIISLPEVKGKKVNLDFLGGSISSDAGALILSEVDDQTGIIQKLSECISDNRRAYSVKHSLFDQLKQRILQICCGYEDANDSNTLRKDPILKMAVDRLPADDDDLASQPTLSRTENMVTGKELIKIARMFVEYFVSSFAKPPKVAILDFDDTNDTVHGKQQLAMFNAYYNEYCFQPMHVYEGITGKLITTILRPGHRPDGKEVVAYLKRIVKLIRNHWPDTILVFRGDGHYSSPDVFTFIAGQEKMYSVVGLTTNNILKNSVIPVVDQVRDMDAGTKRYHSFIYQAGSWSGSRRVVSKVEMTDIGLNIRFISTDMDQAKAKVLYEQIYCARGNDELYIKDHKTYTKSDRTSCHRFAANQFRLFLHSAAYVLLHTLRSDLLRGSCLHNATFDSIRLKLLKVGARVIEMKTKIKVHLPTAYPYQYEYSKCMNILEKLRE